MSMKNRIDRIFGRDPEVRSEGDLTSNPEPAPVLLPLTSVPTYQQWYERDPELLNSEKASLDAAGYRHECSILPDAKVCFSVSIAKKQVAIICAYSHPIEPVLVQVLDEIHAPEVVDETGKVDLFTHDGFAWRTDIRLGDVVRHVATLLSVSVAKVTCSQSHAPARRFGTVGTDSCDQESATQ